MSCSATPTSPCTTPSGPARTAGRCSSRRRSASGYDRLAMQMELRDAIDRDELFMLYQPAYDLRTETIHRRRGADPLAASHPGRRLAGRVHPARRGHRADRPGRPVGPAGRLPAGGCLASLWSAAADRSQRLGRAARSSVLRPRRGPDPERDRHRRRPAHPRDHRDRADAQSRRRGSSGSASSRPWA